MVFNDWPGIVAFIQVGRRPSCGLGSFARDTQGAIDQLGLAFEDKVALLTEIDSYLRAKDPRVGQVMASISGEWQAIQIIRPDGYRAADIRPLVRMNVAVIAQDGERMESGSFGAGGRTGGTARWRERRPARTQSRRMPPTSCSSSANFKAAPRRHLARARTDATEGSLTFAFFLSIFR